jgi:hypothetical protein
MTCKLTLLGRKLKELELQRAWRREKEVTEGCTSKQQVKVKHEVKI